MRSFSPRYIAIVLLCMLNPAAQAQEYSYDGNRWYEVEASVFTNGYIPSEHSEVAVPEKTRLLYLPRLQELLTRGSTFDVDFPGEKAVGLPANTLLDNTAPPEAAAVPVVMIGPPDSPALKDGFHITDFDRDAYIDLGTSAGQFASMNRNLQNSGEHRVLWHKVWRQPMQGRAQTQSIFVAGGDVQGEHTEVEGSVRLSDNGGNVMLDINVWLNSFSFDTELADPAWQLPERPFPLEVSVTPDASLVAAAASAALREVWQLEQTRELAPDQLYYLDHPALGVLIQIRPYMLPPPLIAEDEVDF